LLNITRELGLAGIENLAGVPGHVGGALALNAGSSDWGIWDVVREATLWDPQDDTLQAYQPTEIQPQYRDGNLSGRVVIEALLALEVSTPAAVKTLFEDVVRRKNATQPVTMSSAGCAFRNPRGDSAGRLIDASGLKGSRIGGAVISERHANFIVNDGGASSADVLALIDLMQETVLEKQGIELHREIIVW
jgi:UDP-N-acetylmuramate dehydrogenase